VFPPTRAEILENPAGKRYTYGMSAIDETRPDLRALTTPQAESDDPAHRAWSTAKIEAALTADRAHPGKRLSERAVWRKYGLER